MKVTEQQLFVLIRVLEGSLNICGANFGFDQATRELMYNQIINQQLSKEIIEVDGDKIE
jgi:hypothetical protein